MSIVEKGTLSRTQSHFNQVLEREERSLGSLLEEFCGVRKQKQHQRADWRQRWEYKPTLYRLHHKVCALQCGGTEHPMGNREPLSQRKAIRCSADPIRCCMQASPCRASGVCTDRCTLPVLSCWPAVCQAGIQGPWLLAGSPKALP